MKIVGEQSESFAHKNETPEKKVTATECAAVVGLSQKLALLLRHLARDTSDTHK